jgi:hypothetical protein
MLCVSLPQTTAEVGLIIFLSESHVITDCESAGRSWHRAPIWGSRPDLGFFQNGYSFVVVGRPLRGRACKLSRSWPAIHVNFIYNFTCIHYTQFVPYQEPQTLSKPTKYMHNFFYSYLNFQATQHSTSIK